MNTWFSCKINYLKQAENGTIFKKSEQYMLNALSFTEAEARLQGILEEYIPEYNLATCAKSNINDIVIDESRDFFFKLKVTYVSVDSDSGKEKKISENYLVQADSIKDAIEKTEVRMEGSIVEWEIANAAKTNVVDVFPYLDEAIVSDTETTEDKKEEEVEVD